jgi:hypothetical protein
MTAEPGLRGEIARMRTIFRMFLICSVSFEILRLGLLGIVFLYRQASDLVRVCFAMLEKKNDPLRNRFGAEALSVCYARKT